MTDLLPEPYRSDSIYLDDRARLAAYLEDVRTLARVAVRTACYLDTYQTHAASDWANDLHAAAVCVMPGIEEDQ